ncbi:hypothetical protein [Methanosarcina soligelidi]|uniref:hypothetical protein n=1 Tax=Methanosarcina soligelidi TaxID=1036677 RepID=UPI00064EC0F7|nr:hypothetical protein [Methanosarcina soligelidi]
MIGNQIIENAKILLMPVSDSDKKQVELTVSCDLMTNYEAGSPAKTGKLFQVAQDSEGKPIIVSVGLDNRLYAITRDLESDTGWKQNDITPVGNEKASGVVAFEMFQMSSGSVVLACSVLSHLSQGETTMYISKLLEPGSTVQWDDFTQYWHIRPFNIPGSKMKKIYMGEGLDSTKLLTLVAIERDDKADYYLLNNNIEEDWVWKPLTIPENAIVIHDLALGKQSGYSGAYCLYDTIEGRSLQFTSFPIKEFHGDTFSCFFEPPSSNKITSFAVLPSGCYSDSVYAAGEGLYLFYQGSEDPIKIADKNKIPVQTLLARQDNNYVTLWMVGDDKNLWMTVSPVSNQTIWHEVLPFRKDVSKIAALRNLCYNANHLFLINDENKLVHLWQDPDNTQWCESKSIPLKDTEKIISFDCYTTHISVRDKDSGTPVTDIELNLKSSTLTDLKVNGMSHTILGNYKDQITIKPDAAGNITIINKVSNLSTPIFELGAEWLDKVVEIDPATKVRNMLSEVQSGDDLRAVTLPDGSYLIPQDSVSKDSVDDTVKALKKLTDVTNQLHHDGFQRCVTDGTGDLTKPTTLVAFQRDRNGIHRNLLSTLDIKDDYFWGLHFDGDNVTYFEDKDAHEKLAGVCGIWDKIKSFAGDVIRAIESGIEKVTDLASRVVNKVIEFAVKIGDKIVNFVVETVDHAMSLINFVFQNIKVGFEKLKNWLGFIFDWDDIIRTKKIIVNVTNQTLELAEHKVGNAEKIVNKFFDELDNAIDKIGPITGDVNSINLRSKGEDYCHEYSGAQDFLNSAPGNFANYHIMQGAGASPHSDFYVGSNTDPLTIFFSDVLYPLGEDLVNIVSTFAKDICDMFTANNLTVSESLAKMSKDMFKQVIDLARKAVDGFLKVVESVISKIKDTLNDTLNIPILSALYKSLSGGEISLLDVVALLISIPVTMLCKVLIYNVNAGHSSLFPGGNTCGLDDMEYKELFDTLSDGSMELTKAPTATKSMVIDPTVLVKKEGTEGVKLYRCIGSVVYLLTDFITDGLNSLKAESKDSLPLLPIFQLVLSTIKFSCTFPLNAKGTTGTFSYISWGVIGAMLIGSIAKVISKGNQAVGSAVEAFNGFGFCVSTLMGAVTLVLQIIGGSSAKEIVWDVVTFTETLTRSISGIVNVIATLNPETASRTVLVATALLLGYFASLIRASRIVVIIGQNFE